MSASALEPDHLRVPPGYLLTTFEYDVDDPVVWPEHVHDEHELLWSAGGMARLEAEGRVWAIPPALAVWVPSRIVHRASAERGARVRATYFRGGGPHTAAMPEVVTGVAMTEPLRVLLDHNLQGALDEPARVRVQRVILDLLVPAPRESFELVMPRSPHLHMVASAILADPSDKRTTADWAYECGMHGRTLARQFEAETGMSFTQWRILARLQLAIRELTHGRSIVSVSRVVGYRNPSTFIDHFRELTGQTPAEYVRGSRSERQPGE
ncbi:MAG: AraC family transcriptional regulator [Candidatus Microbacterium colombiense]|nr:MAG: AraC family transcriptional regulator [Microbacterium sp.]